MMKRNKLITGILAMLLVLPLFLGLGSAKDVMAAPADGNAELILHKKKMTKLPNPTIQNTGGIMDGTTADPFYGYDGLADIEFKIYDVTSIYYENYIGVDAQQNALDAAKNATVTENMLVKPGTEEESVTDSNGDLTRVVPKKSGEQDAVYLIVETPKPGVTIGENMVVAFPVYQMEKNSEGKYVYTDTELSTIHLYPKNVVSTDGALTVNKVGTGTKLGLDGAEFIITRNVNTTKQYLSGAKDGLYVWSPTVTDAFTFVTGNNYTIGVNGIEKTGETTKGKMKISGLEVGSYTLTETKAPDNSGLTDVDYPFTISSTQAAVSVEVKNDDSVITKDTPGVSVGDRNYGIGEPITYELVTNIPEGIAKKNADLSNYYTKFDLVDTHDKALTFIDKIGSYKLAIRDESAVPPTDTVIAEENYSVSPVTEVTTDSTKDTFTVSVNEDFIPELTPGMKLVFTYQMKLNDKADLTKGFDNQAKVITSHTTDTSEIVTVVTGGKRFVKKDVDSDVTLAGAKFIVRRGTGTTAEYMSINESTKEISWVKDQTGAYEFITLADGLVDIKGLAYGDYTLIETDAPEGYVTPASPNNETTFTVSSTSYGTTVNLKFELIDPETVPNKHKGSLPSTGGSGIVAFVLIGVIAVGGAALYFTKGRRHIEG